MAEEYDRRGEDVGNIVALEHVNVTVPSQETATLFYVVGLGFTRDPYVMVGRENMWVNAGRQQLHLPTAPPQRLRGHIGVRVPDLDALTARLEAVKPILADTDFGFTAAGDCVEVTGPWGNRFRCVEAAPDDAVRMGISHVVFSTPRGALPGIGRFYEQIMGAPSALVENAGASALRVNVGRDQALEFHEAPGDLPPYDGHHIAVYLANFSGPYEFLKGRDLVSEESNAHQYRLRAIVDPESGESLYTIEHEVRSMRHPMFMRELVNRNPAQSLASYVQGADRL